MVFAPCVFQVTWASLVPWPLLIVPPGEMVQKYPVIPVWVAYEFPVDPTHTDPGPMMTGRGAALMVMASVEVGPCVAQLVLVP